MTSIIDICNVALLEVGNRIPINTLEDNTAASNACAALYYPKISMVMRGANWEFARRQRTLTLFKAASINGVISSDPPPQPYAYSYIYPPDCLKARFIVPTIQTGVSGTPLTTGVSFAPGCQSTITSIPFVVGTDTSDEQPIKTIMTQLKDAQLVYTQDLVNTPDMWDAMFETAATATLASYLINALARDQAQMNAQIAIARAALDSARAVNANESISSADHVPDFLAARFAGWNGYGGWANGANGTYFTGGYDSCTFPDGQFF